MISDEPATQGWRVRLVRIGPLAAAGIITGFSILLSMSLSALFMGLASTPGRAFASGMLIALCVPAIVAPLASFPFVKLLAELDKTQKALQMAVRRDGLTKVYNRHHFMESLEVEVVRAWRSNRSLAVLMIDADRFKAINDRHGHQTGDRVLQEVAAACASILRPYDLLARYGGEEFVALLVDMTLPEALQTAERLRLAVQALPLESVLGKVIQTTVSVGVACLLPGEDTGAAIVGRADEALYKAKRNGRNRCAH